jgi:helix-turn-helix protein/uncharacterized protein DUF4115
MAKRVGPQLREARTRKGIELDQVERVTKIRVKFLSAMEEDRWEDLPAPVYARGFLSTYARHLGLDDEPLLERYREQVGDAMAPSPVPRHAVRPGEIRGAHRSRPSWRLPAALAALVVVLAIAVAIGSGGNGGGEQRGAQPSLAGPSKPAPETTTTATAPAGEVSLELRATADVWVCVIDSAGTHLVDGETLTAEQSRGPFSSDRFEMTLGNGSVELTVDGQPVRVPALAEPLGYRVTASGARRLDPSAQPSCA